MYAIANALEGMSRGLSARLAGMERQALHDPVVRYNAEGLAGLHNRRPPSLVRRATEHKPVSARQLALGLPKRAWRRVTPAFALGDSHFSLQLHFELPPAVDRIELLHAAPQGDRSRRRIVAVPAAQQGDDPRRPEPAPRRRQQGLALDNGSVAARSCLRSIGPSAARVSIPGSVNTLDAGIWPVPSPPWVSRISTQAAMVAGAGEGSGVAAACLHLTVRAG